MFRYLYCVGLKLRKLLQARCRQSIKISWPKLFCAKFSPQRNHHRNLRGRKVFFVLGPHTFPSNKMSKKNLIIEKLPGQDNTSVCPEPCHLHFPSSKSEIKSINLIEIIKDLVGPMIFNGVTFSLTICCVITTLRHHNKISHLYM